jgi:hypothetical protein
MDKENAVYIHRVLRSIKKNEIIYRKIAGTGDYHGRKNKPESERQIVYVFSYMQNLDVNKKQGS